MEFTPALRAGTLLRRYKRFLADIETRAPQRPARMTIHCPNTGAMTGCAVPGSAVWYSTSPNPRRKYPHTWELTRNPDGDWVSVNSARSNRIVAEALRGGLLPGFPPAKTIEREVSIPLDGHHRRGRFDLRVDGVFVEVKTVTLKVTGGRHGEGAFPDAVSERATRHAAALGRLARAGQSAVLVFCVPHSGIRWVRPADEIDPAYSAALRAAVADGVRVLALGCRPSARGIAATGPMPVAL